MWRLLFAGLTALLLWITPALGQGPGEPATQGETSVSALPWAAAVLFTLVIMVIVCMPSRKS
jgi:hypothetical protein